MNIMEFLTEMPFTLAEFYLGFFALSFVILGLIILATISGWIRRLSRAFRQARAMKGRHLRMIAKLDDLEEAGSSLEGVSHFEEDPARTYEGEDALSRWKSEVARGVFARYSAAISSSSEIELTFANRERSSFPAGSPLE